MSRALTAVVLLAFVVLLAPPPAVRADEPGLDEATRLRNASGEDWDAKRYAEAAEKLAKAEAIYRRIRGDHTNELAITLRALTWNLVRDGRPDEAQASFARLLDLDLDAPGVKQEARTAYTAFWEVAKKTEGVAGARSVYEPIREKALRRGHLELAAQVLHDLAWFSRERGDPDGAVELYEDAAAERKKIHDDTGRTWSLCNLANLHLESGDTSKALEPLLEAARLIHRAGVLVPQRAVAVNLEKALEQVEKLGSVDPALEKWLWEYATVVAESDTPEVVPSDYLLVKAARLSAARDPRSAAKAAKRLAEARLRGQPPEVRAHLTIQAARMAIDAGKPKDAAKWLKKVDVGDGPCKPHLEARLHLARALAAAGSRKKKDFDEHADRATEAWAGMDDREGHETALKLLAEAAEALQVESAPARRSAYDQLRSQGSPGGAGSSATGGGDRSGYDALAVNGPLFEIRMAEGKVLVHDLVADRDQKVDVTWKPKSVGLNGLSLVVFGGWVKIAGLSYGGGAASSGQPGRIALDDLGPIRPVPGTGRLVVRKNASVSYDDR